MPAADFFPTLKGNTDDPDSRNVVADRLDVRPRPRCRPRSRMVGTTMSERPLSPATGIILGIAMSAPFWLAAWWLARQVWR